MQHQTLLYTDNAFTAKYQSIRASTLNNHPGLKISNEIDKKLRQLTRCILDMEDFQASYARSNRKLQDLINTRASYEEMLKPNQNTSGESIHTLQRELHVTKEQIKNSCLKYSNYKNLHQYLLKTQKELIVLIHASLQHKNINEEKQSLSQQVQKLKIELEIFLKANPSQEALNNKERELKDFIDDQTLLNTLLNMIKKYNEEKEYVRMQENAIESTQCDEVNIEVKVPATINPIEKKLLEFTFKLLNQDLSRDELNEMRLFCLNAMEAYNNPENQAQSVELNPSIATFAREYEGIRASFSGRWQVNSSPFYELHKDSFTLFNQWKEAQQKLQENMQKNMENYAEIEKMLGEIDARLAELKPASQII